MTIPYRVNVVQDEAEDPSTYDSSFFDLHQFDRGYLHHSDRERVLACMFEPDDVNETRPDEEGNPVAWGEWIGGLCERMPDADIHIKVDAVWYHQYQPENTIASYFRGSPDGGGYYQTQEPDRISGVLTVVGEHSLEWANLCPQEQSDIIDSYLKEYSWWARGETWFVELEKLDQPTSCPFCGQRTNTDWKHIDSLGGIIDGDGVYTREIIKDMLQAIGVMKPIEGIDYEIINH